MGNKDEAKKLFDLLTETFGSKEVAAGILGNIDVETGGSFSADQKQYKGGPGRGLFQMEGQMLNAYNNYISKNSKENNVNTQVEFLKDILSSGDNYDIGAGNRNKIQEAFSSGNVDTISEEFSNRVLRPGKPNLEKRKQSANNFFDELSKAFAGSNAYAAEIPNQENTMPQTAQDPREALTLLQKFLTSPIVDALMSGGSNKDIENTRKSLINIQNTPKDFANNPARAFGSSVSGAGELLLRSLLGASKPMLGGMAKAGMEFGKGMIIPKSDEGGTAQASEQDQILKARTDVALKAEKQNTQRMIDSGQFTPEQIINFANEASKISGIGSGNYDPNRQLASSLAGQPQNGESTPPIEQQAPGLLKRMLTGFAEGFQSGAAPDLYTQRLQKQELEQGGKLGIEMKKAGIDLMKEDQKIEVKRRDEFFKSMTEPLTAETAKSLSQVESALTGIDNITNLLGIKMDDSGQVVIENEALLRNTNFLNKNRQALIRARDNFINKALRRDTGAAIGKEEEKQFKKVYGFDIGIGNFMKNPEVIAKSLLESKDQLSRDRNRLAPNEKLRSQFQALQQQGFSVDEIYEAYRKRGVL